MLTNNISLQTRRGPFGAPLFCCPKTTPAGEQEEMPPLPPIKIMVGQGGWLGVCRHPSIEVSAPRLSAGARYTIIKSRAKRQKAPLS